MSGFGMELIHEFKKIIYICIKTTTNKMYMYESSVIYSNICEHKSVWKLIIFINLALYKSFDQTHPVVFEIKKNRLFIRYKCNVR